MTRTESTNLETETNENPNDELDSDKRHTGLANRRSILVGGLAASAATLVGKRASAATNVGLGSIYRIHPAIGIARVGNAPSNTYFIGPEAPGYGPLGDAPGTTAPPYKVNGQIKPQAARFRIFEYQWIDSLLTPVGEVTLDSPGVLAISWKAHLANKKASFHQFSGLRGENQAPSGLRNAGVTDRSTLEIDFGSRSISGRSLGPVEFRVGTSSDPASETYPLNTSGSPVIDYLGEIRTDAAGRLIVIGGKGLAASSISPAPQMGSFANNDNWFDDVSDGPITAVVTVDDGNGGSVDIPVDDAGGAWVLVAPPDFAPAVASVVTVYDLLYDMAVRQLPIPQDNALYKAGGQLFRVAQLAADYQDAGPAEFPNIVTLFEDEVQHIYRRGYDYRWVTSGAISRHDGLISPTLGSRSTQYRKTRQTYFASMRAPVNAGTSTGTMPRQYGDDTGSSTPAVQRLAVTRTQYGLLRNWAAGQFVSNTRLPPLPTITPHGLDKANLESAAGGAFFPGIEVGWQIRNPALFIEPFRLNLQAMSQYWGETQQIGPGHFSRQMALPWHADFADCRKGSPNTWWPTQRPDDVFASTSATTTSAWARPDGTFHSGGGSVNHEDMVEVWYQFGFVVKQGDMQVETERAAQVPA
ncbi:MAG TPA: LodA/GoxA family CTQ-dependent oxidase [Polyangium sp.]|nr:LodA/GoxA family CTQ-dependent oxidase [Polyangium sp.]